MLYRWAIEAYGKEVNRTPKWITQCIANISPYQWQLFLSFINELDQNRTDIYFRDKEILYLIKLLILFRRQEIRTLKSYRYWVYSSTLLTDKGSLLYIIDKLRSIYYINYIVNNNASRATSATRTVFRLYTN